MAALPEQRRTQILAWLKDDQLLRIEELAARLAVSHMTVHRDLDALVEMGLIEKVHGAARLPDPYKVVNEVCHLCQMPVKPRLQFILTTREGHHLRACCAHCGIMLLSLHTDPQAIAMALLRDFLYGKIINVRQAYFVVESSVSLCCEPTVIAFASKADGTAFQRGFGGQLLDFENALHSLTTAHRCHPDDH